VSHILHISPADRGNEDNCSGKQTIDQNTTSASKTFDLLLLLTMCRRIGLLCLQLALFLQQVEICAGRIRIIRVDSDVNDPAASVNDAFMKELSPKVSRHQNGNFLFDGCNCSCACSTSVQNCTCDCKCENDENSPVASRARTDAERRRIAESYQMQLDEEDLREERRQLFSRMLQSSMSLSFPTAPVASPPSAGNNATLRQIIDADPDFSTLGQALDTIAFNIDALEFPATLFAPNNGAFANLDPTLLNMLLSPGWETHFVNVLRGHIVDGVIRSSSLVDGDLKARNGEILTVTVGENILISSADTENAVVILPETVFAGGVFYELSDVLLPDFVSTTVMDIFEQTPSLSILNELLIMTGLDQLFASRRMLQTMADATGNTFTVFAPNNDAFTALGTDALDYYRSNVDVTTTLLLDHVVLDQVASTRAVDDGPVELPSAAGDTLTFMSDFRDDGTPTYTVNDVEIVMSDVLANDGIVHVIASVLEVPGADPPERPSDRPSITPSKTPSITPTSEPSFAPSPEPSVTPVSMVVRSPTPRPTVSGTEAPFPPPTVPRSGKGSKRKKGNGSN
jgi:uncharacterized surface protein with fasciclin (FAS1) repeats